MKPVPDATVARWLSAQPGRSLFVTSITEAEVRYGLELLPEGERRDNLEKAANAVFAIDFEGRVLPFGRDAASSYALIAAERRAAGRPISRADAQIAAIARRIRARVATRNVADFADCGVELIDPWNAEGS